MLRFRNTENDETGPGALVRLQRAPMGSGDIYCLVLLHTVLSSCALSRLKRLTVDSPAGHSKVIQREWVCDVWTDCSRGVTLVHLTTAGVHWLLAAGATCRAVATAAAGVSAKYVQCMSNGGKLELQEHSATVQQMGETIAMSAKWSGQGLLVAEDGNVLAVSNYGTHSSLLELAREFLEDREWRIR